MTSAARWVLSSTSAPTKKAGIVMSRASPQTTMSFTPIDRDFILKLDCNIDKALNKFCDCSGSLAWESYLTKKSSGPRRRQAVSQARCGPFFRHFCRIPDHLLKSRKILDVARTARSRDAADRLGTVAVILLHGLNHLRFIQHAQMAVQVAVGKRAKLLEITEGQAFWIRDQRREHAEAGPLLHHPIQPVISGAPLPAPRPNFHSSSSFPLQNRVHPALNCPTPYGVPMAHGAS